MRITQIKKGESTVLSDKQIAEIRERAERATPNPWISKKFGGDLTVFKGPIKMENGGLYSDGEICEMEDPDCSDRSRSEINANARFIAAARQDVPALLNTIAELKQAAQDVVDANKYRYRIAYPKTEQEAEDYCNQLIHAGRVEQEAIDRLAALLEGGN